MPPAPRPLLRNWTFVPNRKYKSELKGEGVPLGAHTDPRREPKGTTVKIEKGPFTL
jgi:hypothetical protein